MRVRRLLAFLLALPFGCANDGATQVMPPVVVGLPETAAPAYDDGQVQIYEAYQSVQLPLRRAGNDERPTGVSDPYPRPPFHLASDTRITARFTISNLQNETHAVELLVNPWNEFVRYVPGVVVDNEMTSPNFSGIDRFFVVPPLGRVYGIVTPDDFAELAIDLGTAMKLNKTPPAADGPFAGPALFNRAFNIQNRSSELDPILAPFIPPVAANIVGFEIGLRSYEPAKVALEVILDIEDVARDRVVAEGDDTPRLGRPGAVLSPPAASTRP